MTIMDVMREVRRTFRRECIEGDWRIADNRLTPGDLLLEGDWIAIRGSARADGVYQVTADGLVPPARDECFTGRVWLLDPPPGFVELCAEICAWDAAHPAVPARSERFGDYAWSAQDGCGLSADWRTVFRARLIPYRRMFGEEESVW